MLIEALDDYPVDLGSMIYFTGVGPRDHAGKISGHQEFTGANNRLGCNIASGQPVRAVRMIDGDYEYTGLWNVEDSFIRTNGAGFRLCVFRIRSLDGADTGEGAHAGGGAETEAERRMSTHYRLVRSAAIPERVKALYDHACQICGIRIETSIGPYSEGAHLVPLGGGAAGPDVPENVLCLCPNHHVMLDHGGIYLTDDWTVRDRQGSLIGHLKVHPSHRLDASYARRHRTLMGFEA